MGMGMEEIDHDSCLLFDASDWDTCGNGSDIC